MVVVFYIFNIFVIWYVWQRFHDYLNPIFALFSTWTILSASYDVLSRLNTGYRILSDRYYVYVFLFLCVYFVLSMFILRKVRKRDSFGNKYLVNNLNIKPETVNIVLLIAILANISYIVVLIIAARSFNLVEIMMNIRALTRSEDASGLAALIKIPALIFNFTPLILCYIFMFDVKANSKRVLILMGEMFLISFLLATKGRIIRLTLLILVFLKRKLSKRKFIVTSALTIIAGIILLYVLVVNRDEAFFAGNTAANSTMLDYIFIYFLAPIPSLDRLVNGELSYVTNGFGPRILEYFYKTFNSLIGTAVPHFVDPGYIRISTSDGFVTGNVFTGLGMYFLDFRFWGAIVCAVFFSFVYTYVYKKMVRGKTGFAIFYIINYPYLYFHAFGDLIIGSISVTVQEYLSAIFLTYFFRKIRFRIRSR